MATAASLTTDVTTCPICIDLFDNPKSLPCLHTFCLKCLQGYFKDKCVGDEGPCPVCRKGFLIPSDGLDGLQHNFFIQQLVDVRRVQVNKECDRLSCEVCVKESNRDSDKIPTATVYCVDCNQKLCDQCSRPHRWWKGGAHQVKPLGAEVEQEVIQLRGSYCDQHKDKQVELYCHDCEESICLICSAVKHRNHNCSEIPEVADNFRLKIAEDSEQIQSTIKAVREQLGQIKQVASEFRSKVEEVKEKVLATGEEVKRSVDRQIDDLLMKLQSVTSESAKKTERVQEAYELALVSLESFHTYSQELLDKGRPSDITRAACELHDRATELLNNDVTVVKYCPPHVTFTPADVTQVERLQLVGKLTVRTELLSDGRAFQSLLEGEPVRGVTSLDDYLYLLRGNKSSEQIEVYDIDLYRLVRSLTVSGLGDRRDIVACGHNRCAYISDLTHDSVHRVALPDATMTHWPVNDEPAGLSLTHRHGVLVSCCEVRKIKEFSTDGQLLHVLTLPQDVVSPRHTVQLSSGQFIVCHGNIAGPLHRVCLIGSDGSVIKSFGGPKGSDSQHVNTPVHMAVDRNEFVFVVDAYNDRVLLLSPQLTFVGHVMSRRRLLWWPLRVHLDSDRGRLYVADNEWKYGRLTARRVVVVSV